MPNPETTDDSPTAIRRARSAARTKALADADIPDSLKLLINVYQDHGDDELLVNRDGHEATRLAVASSATMQTSAVDRQTKVLGAVASAFGALLVFMIAGFMYLAGVDIRAAADATREVVGVGAEAKAPVPPEATESAAAEPNPTAGADHDGDAPPVAPAEVP